MCVGENHGTLFSGSLVWWIAALYFLTGNASHVPEMNCRLSSSPWDAVSSEMMQDKACSWLYPSNYGSKVQLNITQKALWGQGDGSADRGNGCHACCPEFQLQVPHDAMKEPLQVVLGHPQSHFGTCACAHAHTCTLN